MIAITTAVVLLILAFLTGWALYHLGKEIGEIDALLRVIDDNSKEYEKKKKVVNTNNNLTRDELLNKLHDIQGK